MAGVGSPCSPRMSFLLLSELPPSPLPLPQDSFHSSERKYFKCPAPQRLWSRYHVAFTKAQCPMMGASAFHDDATAITASQKTQRPCHHVQLSCQDHHLLTER